MHILFIGAKNLSEQGGIETHIREVTTELIKRGHKITIIVNTKKPSIIQGANIIRIPSANNRYLLKISMLIPLLKIVKKIKPDIIHAHDAIGGFGATLFYKNTVYTSHGIGYLRKDWPLIIRNALSIIERSTFSKANKIIAVDYITAEEIKRISKRQVKVIPNGVNTIKYQQKHPFPKEYTTKKPNLLFVGRLIPSKGAKTLIKCCKKLDVQLNIIGTGPQEKTLKRYASNNIKLLGYKNPNIMPSYYQHSDLFILPSEYEGLPIVLLEAMASGKCSIVFDVGDLKNRFIHNKNIFFSTKKTLSEDIKRLIPNKKLREKIGNNSQKEIEENYTWKSSVDKIEEIYIHTKT